MISSKYFENALKSGKRFGKDFIVTVKNVSRGIDSGFDKLKKVGSLVSKYVDKEDKDEFDSFVKNFEKIKTNVDTGINVVSQAYEILS